MLYAAGRQGLLSSLRAEVMRQGAEQQNDLRRSYKKRGEMQASLFLQFLSGRSCCRRLADIKTNRVLYENIGAIWRKRSKPRALPKSNSSPDHGNCLAGFVGMAYHVLRRIAKPLVAKPALSEVFIARADETRRT